MEKLIETMLYVYITLFIISFIINIIVYGKPRWSKINNIEDYNEINPYSRSIISNYNKLADFFIAKHTPNIILIRYWYIHGYGFTIIFSPLWFQIRKQYNKIQKYGK